jgi:hypothetical protein
LDFSGFKRAATIIKNKEHITVNGLKDIIQIKAGMNTGRSMQSKLLLCM